jgi:hypothetical protein
MTAAVRSFSGLGLALVLMLGCFRGANSQTGPGDLEALKKTAPKVYIDCSICDIEYIKTEITFINYVRDRNEAEVHILITTLQTGSGGREYTLAFMGQNAFAGLDDTVKYFSNTTDTDDDVRKGLVGALKKGLMTYVVRTPIARRMVVNYAEERKPATGADKWDSWIFSLSGDGYFSGDNVYTDQSFGLNVSANRVTPDLKVRLGLSAYFNNNRILYDEETIKSTQENYSASSLFVKSLGEHWSAGVSLNADSSTYDNIQSRFIPAPAVEFNVFPYSQSTRRQLCFLYRLQFEITRYRQETIYFKLRENLWKESLSVTLNLKEKWGVVSASLSGSHYFQDMSEYRLSAFGTVQVNLVKGLNVFVLGGGSRIHDQLSLVAGVASLEEILLQRRQLATSYSYFASFGISYTFGSIYTNVVNPRFGRSGSSGASIIID